MGGFEITTWQQLAVLVGIVSAVAGVFGGIIKSQIDKKGSDAAASDRIIRLVETEADKKVEVVRTEFLLQIAEMKLEHRIEIDKMRSEFEREFRTLKKEHDTYRCELAPICGWRNGKVPPRPPKTA